MSKHRKSGGRSVRVFISYGRKDSSELAMRLKAELASTGYDVWLDRTKIRAGRAWEQQIIEGLRKTQVVIALLSPHSTRWNDSDTGDSVCLDELAWARYEPPPTPIIPVLAEAGANIPLTIYRLHYIDFVGALSSDSVFQRKLDELLAAIDGVLAGRTKYRSWESWLTSSLEFDRFLYSKHRGFVGRDWLFKEVDSWRQTASEPALLITGDPGIGKSAIIAEFTYGRLGAAALATYCCQWDIVETLRPANFVRATASQFAARIPAYATQIESPELRPVLERAEIDPASAFEIGVLTPLNRVQPPCDGPALLCVDALDEAVTFREGPTIVNLLESRFDRLPSWIRLIATTRRDKVVLRQLGGIRAREIDAGGPEHLDDLKTYVTNQLEAPYARAALGGVEIDGSLVESLLQHCEGSFLYAEHFLKGVLRGGMQIDQLNDLPLGLDGTYERLLRRAFPTKGAADDIRPVLEVLCAADGPIPRSLLGEATGIEKRALTKLLAPLSPFLRQADKPGLPEVEQSRLSFWHKSFYDFLTSSEHADSEFSVDQIEGDSRLASLFVNRLLCDMSLDPQDTIDALPTYLRRRGLDHLALCGRFFDGLADEQVAHLVYGSSWDSGGFAVGSLIVFAPAFISSAITMKRADAIDRLLDALTEVTRRHYISSGLMAVEKRDDGTESRVITGEATEAVALNRAIRVSACAVWVVDQVIMKLGAGSIFSATVGKLDFIEYMAGGLDIAGWSHGLSGYFEDQGYALRIMISNLKNGKRAKSW